MNHLKKTLEQYLKDTNKEMAAAKDYVTLKLIHDMALGVLLYCYNAGIITEAQRHQQVDALNTRYGRLWQAHLDKDEKK